MCGASTNLEPAFKMKRMLNQPGPLDTVLQALADPSRRLMVERLSRGRASVSELAAPLDMSLPAVLQHLRVLEAAGLVRSEKVGRARVCHVEARALLPVERWVAQCRDRSARVDRAGAGRGA